MLFLFAALGCEAPTDAAPLPHDLPPDTTVVPEPPDPAFGECNDIPPESRRVLLRRAGPPVSILGGDCLHGQSSEHYGWPSGDVALRIVGVYEPAEGGTVRVVLDRDEPTVLVLSSYDPVSWEVVESVEGSLQSVLFDPARASTVTLSKGASSEIVEAPKGWPSAYSWANPEAHALAQRAEDLFELPVRSFHGCYQASELVLGPGEVAPSPASGEPLDCEERRPVGHAIDTRVVEERCPEVAAQKHYCLTMSGGWLLVVGVDNGAVCPVVEALELEPDSLAWVGEHAYACSGYGLFRMSLDTGRVDLAPVPCQAAASYGDGLILQPSFAIFGNLIYTPSLEDAACGVYFDTGVASRASRLTGRGLELVEAWHSTDRIDVRTGLCSELRTVELEGYEGWIRGLSVTEDDRLVLTSGWPEGDLFVFDFESGSRQRVTPASPFLSGLACVRGLGSP